MKCTFVNKNNEQQTIEIPAEFIERTRRSLGCDVREACQIYLSDEGYIDNDVVDFYTQKANGGKKRRGPKRKEDPIKRSLIQFLEWKLRDGEIDEDHGFDVQATPTNVKVTNPERIIQFEIGDETYEVTLSRKRKPKI